VGNVKERFIAFGVKAAGFKEHNGSIRYCNKMCGEM
jgi:hypothetical protein